MVLTTSGSKSTSDLPPQATTSAPKVAGKNGGSGTVVKHIVKSAKRGK